MPEVLCIVGTRSDISIAAVEAASCTAVLSPVATTNLKRGELVNSPLNSKKLLCHFHFDTIRLHAWLAQMGLTGTSPLLYD